MMLLAVNVSKPRPITYRGKSVLTGIFKTPVAGRVMVRRLNVDGDQQADLRIHGGPDQAVYAYAFEHYAYWATVLGRDDFTFGQFGENFTTQGLLEEQTRTGDVLRVGQALLQVTTPRVPCVKLMAKMDDFRFAKPFLASGRTGFYLRVLEEGEVGAGDFIERVASDQSLPTIRDFLKRDVEVSESL
jgi:MOSC domain-containing protein YiiM